MKGSQRASRHIRHKYIRTYEQTLGRTDKLIVCRDWHAPKNIRIEVSVPRDAYHRDKDIGFKSGYWEGGGGEGEVLQRGGLGAPFTGPCPLGRG